MSTVHGVGRLCRLALRRDRLRLPVWLLALGGVVVASAAALPPVYPNQRAIDDYARLFGDNPALVAFAGPGYGFDDPSIGAILANEVQLWGCIGAALMSIFLVNRHTRQEEEAERMELVLASPVGRHAPTVAAVAVVAGANAVLGVALVVALVVLGYGTVGSIALAGSIAAVGLAFTGIAALTAQVASSSRSALGLAATGLGAAFVLRAAGDIADHPVRWASPIAWGQGVRAFAGERWWALLLPIGLAVLAVATAFVVADRRDLGSGLLPARPGRRHAPRWMTSPLGLAWRLQRGAVVGWTLGLFAIGLVYGSIGDEVDGMIEDNPTYADILAQLEGVDVTDSFFATASTQLAMLAAGFAIAAALVPRREEAAGRAESILAAPVSRARWAGSHLFVAAVGTVVVLAAGGLGAGVAYAVVTGDAGEVARLTGAAVVALPGVLVLAAVAVALFGLAPRFALFAWAGLGLVVLVELFGALLDLPGWVSALSPLRHVPAVPAEPFDVVPLLALAGATAALAATGLVGLRRRDVATS